MASSMALLTSTLSLRDLKKNSPDKSNNKKSNLDNQKRCKRMQAQTKAKHQPIHTWKLLLLAK